MGLQFIYVYSSYLEICEYYCSKHVRLSNTNTYLEYCYH